MRPSSPWGPKLTTKSCSLGPEGDHEGDYPEKGREYARAGAAPERKACHQPPTVRQRY